MNSLFLTAWLQGFQHVLPEGLDHLLFISSLSLMTGRLRSSILYCSVFSAAHTCSLALAVYGYIAVPSYITEPLIALSIVLVALMNIRSIGKPQDRWNDWLRGIVVFAFGLFHGLGFATALRESGIYGAEVLKPLLGFNLGVEGAQVLCVIATIGGLRILTKLTNEREKVVWHWNSGLALVALFWFVERIMML